VRRKTFGTPNSFNNHIQSKKHKETVAKAASHPQKTAPKDTAEQKPATVDLVADENMSESEVNEIIDKRISEAVRLTELECLFCTEKSDTFDDNITHMTKVHSFFIPDIEYLVDLRGLIKYLGEKISVGNVCLYCNGKGRAIRSLEAVRAHMVSWEHHLDYDPLDPLLILYHPLRSIKVTARLHMNLMRMPWRS
jgi:pre-60S factor REI1